jgi:cell division initiation protein
MRITPLDIEGHAFARKLRGYDPDEVRTFLTLVSEEYEKLIVENHKMRDDVARMQSILDEHRQREKILRETLYTAQEVSEDLKEQARKEGKILLQESQLKADRLLDHAQQRAAGLEASLADLRMEKHAYLKKVRALIEHHLKLLELHEGQAVEEEKVRFLSKKPSQEAGPGR